MMNGKSDVLVVITVVSLIIGCGDSKKATTQQEKKNIPTTPTSPSVTTSTEEGNAAVWANEVMALQIAGRNSEAMSLLLDNVPPEQPIEVPQFLSISEKEFQTLPNNVSSKLMQTLPKSSDSILSLAKEARTAVQNTSEPENRKARALRLKQFGEDLSRNNRIAVLQMIGNSIARWEL